MKAELSRPLPVLYAAPELAGDEDIRIMAKRIEELEEEYEPSTPHSNQVRDLIMRAEAAERIVRAVRVKAKRWQNQIDNGSNPRNPTVQKARDETLQMVVDTITACLANQQGASVQGWQM